MIAPPYDNSQSLCSFYFEKCLFTCATRVWVKLWVIASTGVVDGMGRHTHFHVLVAAGVSVVEIVVSRYCQQGKFQGQAKGNIPSIPIHYLLLRCFSCLANMPFLDSVTVEVIEGRDLPGSIAISVGGKRETTKDIDEPNACWVEEFVFPACGEEEILFESYSVSGECTGSALLSLSELALEPGSAMETWLPLSGNDETVGEVLVRVEGIFGVQDSASQEVELVFLSAEGLPLCDPYVVGTVGESSFQTTTKFSTSNPVWEECFALDLGLDDTLLIVVKSEADEVGSVILRGTDVMAGLGTDVWLPLKDASDRDAGRLLVAVNDKYSGAQVPTKGIPLPLIVKAVCVEQLPEIDEPYVELSYYGNKKRTTTKAPEPNGDIIFDEEFRFDVDPDGLIVASICSGVEELVGEADIPVQALKQVVCYKCCREICTFAAARHTLTCW